MDIFIIEAGHGPNDQPSRTYLVLLLLLSFLFSSTVCVSILSQINIRKHNGHNDQQIETSTMAPLMLAQPLIPIVLLCSAEMSPSVSGWWIIKEVFVHKYLATPFTNTRLLRLTLDNTLSDWVTLNVRMEWWALTKLFTESHSNWFTLFPVLC